jgi:hypothetical protein
MMDPIIEAVLDSRRLTFEDETTIRHQLSSLKAPTLLARACSTGPGVAASAILCTTGGLLLFHTVSTSSVAIQKIQPTLGKIFSIAAGITGIAMCVRRLSEKSLIHQVCDQSINQSINHNQSINQSITINQSQSINQSLD